MPMTIGLRANMGGSKSGQDRWANLDALHLFTDMVLGSALDPMERQERFLPDEFIAIFKLLFWHLG